MGEGKGKREKGKGDWGLGIGDWGLEGSFLASILQFLVPDTWQPTPGSWLLKPMTRYLISGTLAPGA